MKALFLQAFVDSQKDSAVRCSQLQEEDRVVPYSETMMF